MLKLEQEPRMDTIAAASLDREMSLRDLLRILRRRAGTILLTVLALTIPIALYAALRPQYTARAIVMLDPQVEKVINLDQVRPVLPSDPAAVETQASVIASGPLVERVMTELGLFEDPEFALPNVLRRLTGLDDADPRLRARANVASRLTARRIGASYAIEVAFVSSDPGKAAAVANRIAEIYIETQVQQKQKATASANRWLALQLSTQQKDLLDAERLVAATRSEHQFVGPNGVALALTNLERINRELIETRVEQARVQAKLSMIDATIAKGERLDALPDAISSPLIAQLRMQEVELMRRADDLSVGGAETPRAVATREELAKIRARVEDEINRLTLGLRNEAAVLRERDKALSDQFEAAKTRNAEENGAAVRLQEQERDAGAKRSLYEALLRRQQETTAQANILEPDARLVTAAQAPLSPNLPLPLAVAAGAAFAAVIGALIAVIREGMDQRLYTRAQAESALGAACLGLVPRLKSRQPLAKLHEELRGAPGSAFRRAIQAIHVEARAGTNDAKVLLVASALPGEGKTTLATALAICAAQTGARTVLVDLDWSGLAMLRRMQPQEGGAEADAAEATDRMLDVEKTVILDQASGVDILPVEAGAPSLAAPHRLARFVQELRQRYDFVLIDTTALVETSDARALAACADATIFVVKWGSTNRDVARSGMTMLAHACARVLGVALTQVDLNRQAAYEPGGTIGHGAAARA